MLHTETTLWFQKEQTRGISWMLAIKPGNELFGKIADSIKQFTTPVNAPSDQTGGVEVFTMTPVSIWSFIASGGKGVDIIRIIEQYHGPISDTSRKEILKVAGRWGKIQLIDSEDPNFLVVRAQDHFLLKELIALDPRLKSFQIEKLGKNAWMIARVQRGRLKQAFTWYGFPVVDKASYQSGLPLEINFRDNFSMRDYQDKAVESLIDIHSGPREGVVISPCGSGKTVIATGLVVAAGVHSLIVVTSIDALRQFRDELLNKTTLKDGDIGEYSGRRKQIRPVTITTYNTLTRLQHEIGDEVLPLQQRISRCFGVPGEDPLPADLFHQRLSSMELFSHPGWGVVIFDEAHALPADTFRLAAHLQSIGRAGFTSTPIREDGRENDMFSLIGPESYKQHWKESEQKGWISNTECFRIEVPLSSDLQVAYDTTNETDKRYRISTENPRKIDIVKRIVEKERKEGRSILIIGEYIDFLKKIAETLRVPFVYGDTKSEDRKSVFDSLRSGKIHCVVASRIACLALDFPELDTVIRVTALYGSRQQETQGWGRAMRPKKTTAHLYAIVTPDTRDDTFALRRQEYFEEQGYIYKIETI